ncbi:hypothetical protein J4E08_00995 [Sagittula sp. NFXS13]|uniref:Uncharacterized protein n=1 Tax=Sagittula marina TaxID=943940 RepID=A0A7W6DMC4_9RHOB|nr:hypothetical protein [Sagittula marina]MBB3985628.1 hypothetical protein [Sagittula marina]
MSSIETFSENAAPAAKVEHNILWTVLVFLEIVALATYFWGLPALAMIALTCVPVMFVVLLLITVGK